MSGETHYDVLVIGSGPAGQKAAIQAAKAGKRVAVVEREQGLGGACVHHGTIPSKTLREGALQLDRFKRSATMVDVSLRSGFEIPSLMHKIDEVVGAHVGYITDQLKRNGVECHHGRAAFVSDHEIEVVAPDRSVRRLTGALILIATGSKPRTPESIPVDHEHILDSDSIVSMVYLPRSLAVLGGGVIACEYASIFASLGVSVTVIDRAPRPLQFMDRELTDRFLLSFTHKGGVYLASQPSAAVKWDGVSKVVTTLADGRMVETDKMLVAFGRTANLDALRVAAAGLKLSDRGMLQVDGQYRTNVPHIYAVGDVIGPPALAATSMEQGRRAVRHALGLDPGAASELTPIGVYTIPEMASVGVTEEDAIARHGSAVVGRALFTEVARGQISGMHDGMLKLVADPTGEKLLGAHIIGDGATELIHVAQMGLLTACDVDLFVETIFNFPTLAESYRVAALDIVKRRPK
jgi:NAD(P) transhydrogenase